jgi:hypothetical protein
MAIFGNKSFARGQFGVHVTFEKTSDDRVTARATINGKEFEHTAPDELTANRELKALLRDKVLQRDL